MKTYSAKISILCPLSLLLSLIEINDVKLLTAKRRIPREAISSIIVLCENPKALMEERIKKVNPRRFDDVFKIWGNLLSIELS